MSKSKKRYAYEAIEGEQARIKKSTVKGQVQFDHYFNYLSMLAINCYKWKNLPKEINERYMERTLYYRGLSIFYLDTKYDRYFAQEGTPASAINMTRDPTEFLAYGPGGYYKKLSWNILPEKTECVPIWSNYMRYTFINSIQLYADRLCELDMSFDVNVHSAKTPLVVTAPESAKLTAQTVTNDISNNEPNVFLYSDQMTAGAGISITSLNTGTKFMGDMLLQSKIKVWNEICTFLGIDNANQEKKERLVTDEVSANNGQILMSRLCCLDARRQACDAINERYNLDISVEFNEGLERDKIISSNISEGGVGYGTSDNDPRPDNQ